jgi:hypothetical protein
MEKRLYWKEITADGLVKEPKECGPGYSTESLNGWNGFETEEDAFNHMKYMKETYSFDISGNYILVPVYSP